MSENTLNAALRRMGFQERGFMTRPRLSARLRHRCLTKAESGIRRGRKAQWGAHVDGDSVRRAYARAELQDERVGMMTWWAEKVRQARDAAESLCLSRRNGRSAGRASREPKLLGSRN